MPTLADCTLGTIGGTLANLCGGGATGQGGHGHRGHHEPHRETLAFWQREGERLAHIRQEDDEMLILA